MPDRWGRSLLRSIVGLLSIYGIAYQIKMTASRIFFKDQPVKYKEEMRLTKFCTIIPDSCTITLYVPMNL